VAQRGSFASLASMSSTWPLCWYEVDRAVLAVFGAGATAAAEEEASLRSVLGPEEEGRSEGIDSEGFTAAFGAALLLLFVMSCWVEIH